MKKNTIAMWVLAGAAVVAIFAWQSKKTRDTSSVKREEPSCCCPETCATEAIPTVANGLKTVDVVISASENKAELVDDTAMYVIEIEEPEGTHVSEVRVVETDRAQGVASSTPSTVVTPVEGSASEKIQIDVVTTDSSTQANVKTTTPASSESSVSFQSTTTSGQ